VLVSAILLVMKPILTDELLRLLQKISEHYQPPPVSCKRGRAPHFSELSFLLLAVVAVVTKTFADAELRRLLQADAKLLAACAFAKLLAACAFVRVPHRTTILRRLKTLTSPAERQISLTGAEILTAFSAEQSQTVSAIDGRMYQAVGPRWHKKHRQQNLIPPRLRNVDTESEWFKSGYRGFVQGYRLVLQSLVFPFPVPLSASWKANNIGESTVAKQALSNGLLIKTDVLLGDETFGGKDLTKLYRECGGWLLSPKQLPKQCRSFKHDLYDYRKETIELLFQRIIQAFDLKTCQVKGLHKNGAFVLASVWVYQLVFLMNFSQTKPLFVIKELIESARWRIQF
jgi:hypothetical protein